MKGGRNFFRIIGLVALVAIIGVTLWYSRSLDATSISGFINDFGALAWLVFMLLYALGTVFFFPGSILTLAGGALFGPVWGTLYNLTGATIGASLAFLIAKYIASDWVEQKTGGRLKQLKEGVEKEGWRFVAFVRLVPLFPFNLLNYALGLTRIRFTQYLVATYIFMLPGAIAYTYLGYAGREAVGGGEDLIQKGLLALALLAVVAFLPRFIAHFRIGSKMNVNELNEQLLSNEKLILLDVRSNNDYHGELGHVRQAINLPLESLEANIESLNQYMEQPLAIICTTDRRSKKAAQILAARGFADIHVVMGGMTKWNENNFSVERS